MNKGVKISELPIAVEIPDGSLLPAVVEGETSAVEIETLRARVQTDLTDYYTKTETNELVSKIPKFAIEVVDTLPTENISNTTVYLVKSGEGTENLYTEYIYVNETWEKLGEQTVDLTDYYTKAETDAAIEAATAGGGNVKLYEEYGQNTDGALTQKFVSGKLNGDFVNIGEDTYEGYSAGSVCIQKGDPQRCTLTESIIIGRYSRVRKQPNSANSYVSCIAIGDGADISNHAAIGIGKSVVSSGIGSIGIGVSCKASNNQAVAIGSHSTVQGLNSIAIGSAATSQHQQSVALGSVSKTSRDLEFSVGGGALNTGGKAITRYVANVTAGELDTDAVNLKQLKDAVAALQAQINELKGTTPETAGDAAV